MRNRCARPEKTVKQKTSLQALKSLGGTLGRDNQKIFDELLKHGDKGLTGKELEIKLGMRSASSRIHDMVKKGWIIRTKKQRRNPGRKGPETGALADILIVPKHVQRNGPIPLAPSFTKKKYDLLLVRGVEGNSIYLNAFRIAGPKPWGGGKVIDKWVVPIEDIKKAVKNF